ncbi:MAG: hypothetical protein Kow0069_37820 [Promethearchaeota archaeon]
MPKFPLYLVALALTFLVAFVGALAASSWQVVVGCLPLLLLLVLAEATGEDDEP